MSMDFTPVNLEQRQDFYALQGFTPRLSLDYTLPNLWGWQAYYGLEWRFDNRLCWIRQHKPHIACWAPLGDWASVDWAATLSDACGSEGHEFVRVPEELAFIWQAALPGRVSLEEDRGQWEYLYKQQDLADLAGKDYHKKRSHFNGYIKNYGQPNYHELDDAMVEDVLAVQDNWCQWHDCEDSPSLQAENEAVNRVLSHWDAFRGLIGGSLYVDGRMVAFSVGEKLDDQSLGVHYEKGLNGFKGVYQAINCMFTRQAGANFTVINRAQDLNEEGLRQAKMTYMPIDFLRKYKVRIHA